MRVVGLDYDSPANNADSTTESMYIHYMPTNDKLVAAWRNAFAAHCNGQEDLLLMEDLGEFAIGWDTTSITATHPVSGNPALNSANFDAENYFDWAPLDNAHSSRYVFQKANAASLGTVTINNQTGVSLDSREISYHCSPLSTRSVRVGSHNGSIYWSKFALLGGSTKDDSTGTAKIGIIDAFNKANPVVLDMGTDPFGQAKDITKKYGSFKLYPFPETLKIQTGMSTHFTIPVGGINVMCGLLRLTDTLINAATGFPYNQGDTNSPDESGEDHTEWGTLTVWVDGWEEF